MLLVKNHVEYLVMHGLFQPRTLHEATTGPYFLLCIEFARVKYTIKKL